MVRICRRWTPGEDELIRVAAGANKAPRGYTADDFRAGDRHLPKVVDPGARRQADTRAASAPWRCRSAGPTSLSSSARIGSARSRGKRKP